MSTATLVRDDAARAPVVSPARITVQVQAPPTELRREPRAQTVRDRALPRRALCAVYRRLPPSWQQRAIRLGAAKVTYGACAVIQDSRGRVLLAHHTYRRRAWGLPGGLVGRREQPFETIERELREELGLHADVGPLLYAETSLPAGHLTLYYRATISGMPRTDGVEIDGFQYATAEEAAALLGPDARPWLDCLRTRRAS